MSKKGNFQTKMSFTTKCALKLQKFLYIYMATFEPEEAEKFSFYYQFPCRKFEQKSALFSNGAVNFGEIFYLIF